MFISSGLQDCLSSVLVARDGFGDMAVSNAIGSNVFDIDLGLGFPFLLRILIQAGKPLMLLDAEEQVQGLFIVYLYESIKPLSWKTTNDSSKRFNGSHYNLMKIVIHHDKIMLASGIHTSMLGAEPRLM